MFLVDKTRDKLLAVSAASRVVVARVKHQKRVFVTFDTSERGVEGRRTCCGNPDRLCLDHWLDATSWEHVPRLSIFKIRALPCWDAKASGWCWWLWRYISTVLKKRHWMARLAIIASTASVLVLRWLSCACLSERSMNKLKCCLLLWYVRAVGVNHVSEQESIWCFVCSHRERTDGCHKSGHREGGPKVACTKDR